MSRSNPTGCPNDNFDMLSAWINRQVELKHGSDFQLTDQPLNLPLRIHFDAIDGLNQIDAWGFRVSLVHLSFFTMQIVPTERLVRATLPITGTNSDTLELTGRIVYCSQCIPGMYRSGVVLDWESLSRKDVAAQDADADRSTFSAFADR